MGNQGHEWLCLVLLLSYPGLSKRLANVVFESHPQ